MKTKQDFTAWMKRRLDPIRGLYSPGRARLLLGDMGATYPPATIGMEAFSRPLWALVPFWAGGGSDPEFEAIYRDGLVHGTDPADPEYWGVSGDYDQRFVEMAAIACGLLFAPDKLWEPLTQAQRENLAAWLGQINRRTLPACNWLFFLVLVNAALHKRGMPHDAARTEECLAQLESFYLGGGWYRDGSSDQKDYYISFAFHYYGLLYAAAMEGEEPARCALYRERAGLFARDFIYWFAEDGSALPYGRSLAYRFGQAAFWSAYVFAGLTGFSHGVVKGLLSRHLAWWDEQKMTDRDGVLTIGYAYPNLIMAERYNAPGSPYWGMKTLLLLALPDSHPFWQADPEPLPPLESLHAIEKADLLIRRKNGDVTAYAAGVCERYGHGHVPEKYAKFAYSTRYGFSCARSQLVLHENCPDSMLAFVPDGGDAVFVRLSSKSWRVTGTSVEAEWSPFPGIEVKTVLEPTETGCRRTHTVRTAVACTAYDCGFSVRKFVPGFHAEAGDGFAIAANNDQSCTVRGEGEGCLVGADPNTNVLYPNAEIPAVKLRFAAGEERTVVTVVEMV